jgi:hypothetical protein
MDSTGAGMVADLAVTMAPVMEEHGVVTQALMDTATLKARVVSQIEELGSVITGRSKLARGVGSPRLSLSTLELCEAVNRRDVIQVSR